MIVELNGTIVNNNSATNGAKDGKITIRKKDEDGQPSASFAEKLIFWGEGYEIIKAELMDPEDGKLRWVDINIYEDCCGSAPGTLIFSGRIQGDAISWCQGECSVEATAIEWTEDTESMHCLKDKLIAEGYDNATFEDSNEVPYTDFDDDWPNRKPMPVKMRYCNEIRPTGLMDFIIIAGAIMNIIMRVIQGVLAVFLIIEEILQIIANIITFGTTDLGDEIGDVGEQLQNFEEGIEALNAVITGCGFYHPSPLVRHFVRNGCRQCGVELESSILNEPNSDYFRSVHFEATVAHRGVNSQVSGHWDSENTPLYTVTSYLQSLKVLFNAEWDIKDGMLRFERKDFFWAGETFVNFEELEAQGVIEGQLCYSWRAEEMYASVRVSYTKDGLDIPGNEAFPRYTELVSWNDPLNTLQRGLKEVTLPFAPSRIRNDGIKEARLDHWSDVGFINWIYGNDLDNWSRVILLDKHVMTIPKMLIWDGNSFLNGRVRKYDIPGSGINAENNYNWPYQVNETGVAPNTAYPTDEPDMGLYGRFHALDNPKLLNDQGKDFEFTFKYTCEHLNTMDVRKTVELPIGEGRIDEITIDTGEQTMTIKGKV